MQGHSGIYGSAVENDAVITRAQHARRAGVATCAAAGRAIERAMATREQRRAVRGHSAYDPMSWPKRCACGARWVIESWSKLLYVGLLDLGGEILELRNCICHSTIAVGVTGGAEAEPESSGHPLPG